MKEKMIKYLRDLGNGRIAPESPRLGICSNFGDKFKEYLSNFVDVRKWPEYSGIRSHPVPSPDKNFSPKDYYHLQMVWVGDYGDARKNFCTWIADELERELKENDNENI